jgi:hypothetical protein
LIQYDHHYNRAEGISAVEEPDNSQAAPQLHPSLAQSPAAHLVLHEVVDTNCRSLSGILVFVVLILVFENGCYMHSSSPQKDQSTHCHNKGPSFSWEERLVAPLIAAPNEECTTKKTKREGKKRP